ncbi:MAG: pyruvate dehydrogenase (acetyl-transferring) E1 component subunit alpha, partial [Deltaproteobacteria bacterium]|nr:pyruvate dehydrogenase (acetyl-transferring) E1 component subunit alpha [Deltaproteobacteria bacterium]
SRYRAKEEVEAWRVKEPLIRLRLFMEKKGLWTREYEEGVGKAALGAVDREIEAYEGLSAPEPADMFRYTYDELTARQKREIKEFGWER